MSKLYAKYLELKEKDKTCWYLFKVGIFYILLDADAIACSKQFALKLTHLNENVMKCGFPLDSLEKYIRMFEGNKIAFKIIDQIEVNDNQEYLKDKKLLKLLSKIKKEDINKINGMQALMLLNELKELL